MLFEKLDRKVPVFLSVSVTEIYVSLNCEEKRLLVL